MIKFYCPNCKQKLGVPDEYAGRRIRCNKCSQAAIVPKPQPAAAAPAPAEPPAPPPKPAQAKVEPPQPVQPKQQLDQLDLVADDNLPPPDPNLEAIRQAGHDRFSKMKVSPSAAAKTSSATKAKAGAAAQVAKGMGKIPLSLAACFACMTAVIIVWVVIAKISGYVIGFVVIGVPVAGAWGLTRFTEHRGVMLGLLAAFLGFIGMTIGHIAVAKYVVMPMLEEDSTISDTLNEAFDEGLGDASMLDQETVNDLAADDEEMFYIAAMSLVSEGKMDRQTVKQILQQDMADIMSEEEEDREQEETASENTSRQTTENLDESYSQIDQRLLSWNDDQRKQAVRKNYAELTKLRGEFLLNDTGVGTAVTFIWAFVGSFSLFDLLWYPMGLFGAFKLAAALDGEE